MSECDNFNDSNASSERMPIDGEKIQTLTSLAKIREFLICTENQNIDDAYVVDQIFQLCEREPMHLQNFRELFTELLLMPAETHLYKETQWFLAHGSRSEHKDVYASLFTPQDRARLRLESERRCHDAKLIELCGIGARSIGTIEQLNAILSQPGISRVTVVAKYFDAIGTNPPQQTIADVVLPLEAHPDHFVRETTKYYLRRSGYYSEEEFAKTNS